MKNLRYTVAAVFPEASGYERAGSRGGLNLWFSIWNNPYRGGEKALGILKQGGELDENRAVLRNRNDCEIELMIRRTKKIGEQHQTRVEGAGPAGY